MIDRLELLSLHCVTELVILGFSSKCQVKNERSWWQDVIYNRPR